MPKFPSQQILFQKKIFLTPSIFLDSPRIYQKQIFCFLKLHSLAGSNSFKGTILIDATYVLYFLDCACNVRKNISTLSRFQLFWIYFLQIFLDCGQVYKDLYLVWNSHVFFLYEQGIDFW